MQQRLGAHRLDHVDLGRERIGLALGRQLESAWADAKRHLVTDAKVPVGGRDRQADLLAAAAEADVVRAHPVDRGLEQVHLRRADEARDEQVGGPGEDRVRARDLLDPAGAHDRDPIRHRERLELVVGHDHGRLVEALQDLLDLAAHGLAQLHVEPRERLVEQEADGVADDRAADRDPLLLALGELARPAIEHVLELQHARDLAHAPLDLGPARPLGVERIFQVLAHGQARVERVELEGHRDVALARGELVDPPAGEPDLAAGRGFQPGDHPQRRGLAAARGAEQADHLARLDREINRIHRDQLVEALGDLGELDVGHAPAGQRSKSLRILPSMARNRTIVEVASQRIWPSRRCVT